MIFAEYDAPPAEAAPTPPLDRPEPTDLPAAPARPAAEPTVRVPERDVAVRGAFLGFWDAFGRTLCGLPLTDEVLVDGVRCQVFDHLVLEEWAPGQVRPAAIGGAWLAARARGGAVNGRGPSAASLPVVDLVGHLAEAPGAAYPTRTLADIRYLVVHHTGAPIEVGPRQIAEEHVHALGWPGIGYHYVVGADGTAWRTQDLTAISHHARQFNPVAVGVALAGDLAHAAPPPEQLDGAARLLADLADRLGLPPEAIRGHGEMVATPCPGDAFLADWKPRLLAAVARARRGIGSAATATVAAATSAPSQEPASGPGSVQGPAPTPDAGPAPLPVPDPAGAPAP